MDQSLNLSAIGFSEADVLAAEQNSLRYAAAHGGRLTMRSADRVERLRCDAQRGGSAETPRCSYLLFYTDLQGQTRQRMRKNRFFSRDMNGRWESVIVVGAS